MIVFSDVNFLWSLNLGKAVIAVCDKTKDNFISENNSKIKMNLP